MTLIIKSILIFAGFIHIITSAAIYQATKLDESESPVVPYIFAAAYAATGLFIFWLSTQRILI